MPQSKLKEPLMTETIFALLSISFALLCFALLSMDGKFKSMFILKQILTSFAPFSSLALRLHINIPGRQLSSTPFGR